MHRPIGASANQSSCITILLSAIHIDAQLAENSAKLSFDRSLTKVTEITFVTCETRRIPVRFHKVIHSFCG